MKEALSWCGVWVSLALAFTVLVYFLYQYQLFGILDTSSTKPPPAGHEAAILFLTGYIVELSLSADNIFVIALIFTFFRVASEYQHRVLFWGILGAIIMRATMILGGIALIHRFEWVLYVFGAFLIYSAFKMLFGDSETDPEKNLIVRLTRKLLPITQEFHGSHFLVRHEGRFMLTPLALVLVAVESADVIFAVDSIPAIFAITDIPFIVFTSNIFAILGLRSMYFALSAVIKKFRYLKVSLAVLLAIIGLKMLLKTYIENIPCKIYILLVVIILVLGAGIVASVLYPENKKNTSTGEPR